HTGLIIPAANDIAGHIREQEKLILRVPEGPLGKKEACSHLCDLSVRRNNLRHSSIADVDGHFFASARIFATERSPTYQLSASTSLNTTQMSLRAIPVTSLTALATRLETSSRFSELCVIQSI